MCGIVGVAAPSPWADRDSLPRMRDTMRHRGPDDAGLWWSPDGRVGLGHRRLSIIDLSPGGHQPMEDGSGERVVVFNGEIYDYREVRADLQSRGHAFRTASDTEVLLASYREWGTDCVARLNGMFAFALVDRARGSVFLARDRAGEKPLFYRLAQGRLSFASELKALLADPAMPRRLDLEALDHYLAYGYVPGELCLLAGVRKLPSGHAALYDVASGTLKTWSYWSLPEPELGPPADEGALLEELERLLLDSVRLRLVSDVPVGVLLSSGIDSGLVAAMAARVSPRTRTYTVALRGHPELDEGPQARRIAEHLGTEHTEIVAEPPAPEMLTGLARQYDEPIADYSMIPTFLVSRAIRAHATVALGGDGGDELFGGYPHYEWLAWQERARRVLPGPLRTLAASAAGRVLPAGLPGRSHLVGLSGGLGRAIAHVNLYFDRDLRRRLLVPAIPAGVPSPEERREALCPAGLSRLQRATRTDFRSTLPDAYLVKVDRASMLNSLEVRAPFLDHRLIDFAFSRLPDPLRVAKGRRKVLPRRLAERLLPPGLDFDTKRGFTVPLASWLAGPWGERVEEVLRGADPALLDRSVVTSLLEGQRRGRRNAGRLFALVMLEMWRREYRVGLPAESAG